MCACLVGGQDRGLLRAGGVRVLAGHAGRLGHSGLRRRKSAPGQRHGARGIQVRELPDMMSASESWKSVCSNGGWGPGLDGYTAWVDSNKRLTQLDLDALSLPGPPILFLAAIVETGL